MLLEDPGPELALGGAETVVAEEAEGTLKSEENGVNELVKVPEHLGCRPSSVNWSFPALEGGSAKGGVSNSCNGLVDPNWNLEEVPEEAIEMAGWGDRHPDSNSETAFGTLPEVAPSGGPHIDIDDDGMAPS